MIIKKPNNKYICDAIDILDEPNAIVAKDKNGILIIESKYNTYISGFGGSIIQSGLLATLMIFEANTEKNKIIEILFNLLNATKSNTSDRINKTDKFYKSAKALSPEKLKQLRDELIDMAVSLKLAMRCFKQVDNIKD